MVLLSVLQKKTLAEIVAGIAGDDIRRPPLRFLSPCLKRSGWWDPKGQTVGAADAARRRRPCRWRRR